MKRPRAILKWTGLALCALILVVWLVSGWHTLYIWIVRRTALYGVVLDKGCVAVQWTDFGAAVSQGAQKRWTIGREFHRCGWRWASHWEVRTGFGTVKVGTVAIPLYIPFLLLAAPTAWLFYTDRRTLRRDRAGHCIRCGYDRAGLEAATPCPECGRTADAGATQ